MRRRYDTYANFRPVFLPGSLGHFSPLKAEIIGEGIDIMIIRELVGGLYFGKKEESGINDQGLRYAQGSNWNTTMKPRFAASSKVAFQTAMKRRRKLHSVHKSNVLKSSVLWTEIVEEVAPDYPDVEVHHVLVDAAATYLCLKPTAVRCHGHGEPVRRHPERPGGGHPRFAGPDALGMHRPGESPTMNPPTAPHRISPGQNIANPYSMIGSVAMMLEMSFGMDREAKNLWQAMQQRIRRTGIRPRTFPRPGTDITMVSTQEFGDRVATALTTLPV